MKVYYQPDGMWHNYDFLINKHYWQKKGNDASLEIRQKNLLEITSILAENNIFNWLQGRTLLGIFKFNQLLEDHDDDIGIFEKDLPKLLDLVKTQLSEKGFKLIRKTKGIVSFIRDYRYVDICIFVNKGGNLIGYNEKFFQNIYYSSFSKVSWRGHEFNIPNAASQLLGKMYPSSLSPLLVKLKKVYIYIKYNSIYDCWDKKIAPKVSSLAARHPIFAKYILKYVGPVFGIYVLIVEKDFFLNLLIEPKESFNWTWRKRHLDLVTNNAKLIRIADIVNFLSDTNHVNQIESQLQETDTSKLFLNPTSLDMDFWWSGNNYFWYCIKYQFKKNVVSYADANSYIKQTVSPKLYSADYYNSLDSMSDKEIEKFLSTSILEISEDGITSGKHRVFAMIGRLASRKSYIPMTAIIRGTPLTWTDSS